MCVCVFCARVFVCLCVCRENLQEFSVSQSLPRSLLLSSRISSYSPSLHTSPPPLLPGAARRSGVGLAVVGSAVPPLSYLLEMLPLLVSGAYHGSHRRGLFTLSGKSLVRLVGARVLARPNLFADLVHGAQVWVVNQLHEVPVPKLLIGHRRPAPAAGFYPNGGVGGQIGRGGGRRRYDFQGDAQQGLGEAVLHGVALVDPDVSLQDPSNKKTPVRLEDTLVETDLLSRVLRMFLEGPGDSGLKGFGDALQESAASLDGVQFPLCNAVLVMVSGAESVGVSVPHVLPAETSLGVW